jgi:hypothetical protein
MATRDVLVGKWGRVVALGRIVKVSRSEPSDAKLAEVRGLLAKRNTDKRLRPSQIEGSVFRPAKWDFRLEGLLRAKRG